MERRTGLQISKVFVAVRTKKRPVQEEVNVGLGVVLSTLKPNMMIDRTGQLDIPTHGIHKVSKFETASADPRTMEKIRKRQTCLFETE